jgi:hypothetical protein
VRTQARGIAKKNDMAAGAPSIDFKSSLAARNSAESAGRKSETLATGMKVGLSANFGSYPSAEVERRNVSGSS